MKLSTILSIGLVTLSAASFAREDEKVKDPWLVRIRALKMEPANHSRPFSALNTNFGSNAISLNTKTFPEVDISYFFTKHIAAELVLTYPQRHDVTLAGVGNIGTVDHLPPTLSIQYHYPINNSPFKPYVGLGINYTRITRSRLNVLGTDLDVTRHSFGLAYGLGCDYKINDKWSVNVDYRYVNIKTNVKVASSKAILTNLDVNPNLFSIGVGYRF